MPYSKYEPQSYPKKYTKIMDPEIRLTALQSTAQGNMCAVIGHVFIFYVLLDNGLGWARAFTACDVSADPASLVKRQRSD